MIQTPLRTLYMDSEEGELVEIAKLPMKDIIQIIKLAKQLIDDTEILPAADHREVAF